MNHIKYLLFVILLTIACSEETKNNDSALVETPTQVTPTPTPEPQVLTEQLDSQTIQVKNLNLLRDSVDSCVGQGLTIIKDSMFLSKIATNSKQDQTSDRIRFLVPNEFPVGQDIFEIAAIAERLVNTEKNSRFTSVADGISFTYLSTLQLIGDIVAHNCSSSIGTCQCNNRAAAAGLVSRCFPYLNQKTDAFNETVDNIKAICEQESVGGVPGFRVAIASIISSLAFAISR